MKAAFMKNLDDIIIKEIDLAKPEDYEIRIKVDACGICGTDVTSAMDGREEYGSFGHEVAGTILEVGRAVRNLKVGQKVALDSSTPCGQCENCHDGRQELCTNIQSFFYKGQLGFAEEMITPAISAVPYEGLSAEEACLAEPLGVAIDMHRLADIQIGSHVVVSGLGTIGLMALRLAKLSGAQKIYACGLSRSKARNELAKKFGADEIIEVDKTPITEYKFFTPPDRFLISSPPQTMPNMFKVAAKGALISYIGIKYGEGATLSFDANEFHFKKLQLRGSFASPAMYTPKALNLLRNKLIDGKSLISHCFSLDRIKEAMAVAAKDKERAVKVVVRC
jgi:L-iditol 2-dehydrogenase